MPDFIRGLKMAGLAFKNKKDDTPEPNQAGGRPGHRRAPRGRARAGAEAGGDQGSVPASRAVGFLVDGVDAAIARDSLETEIHHEFESSGVAAKVWESAGGFAPTVGILGAVLGLIHVMENLSDPSKLGGGIATAFVATVYGVGAANLLFLPIANKVKRKIALEKDRKTVIAEGVLSIQAGLNPRVLRREAGVVRGAPRPEEGGEGDK